MKLDKNTVWRCASRVRNVPVEYLDNIDVERALHLAEDELLPMSDLYADGWRACAEAAADRAEDVGRELKRTGRPEADNGASMVADRIRALQPPAVEER